MSAKLTTSRHHPQTRYAPEDQTDHALLSLPSSWRPALMRLLRSSRPFASTRQSVKAPSKQQTTLASRPTCKRLASWSSGISSVSSATTTPVSPSSSSSSLSDQNKTYLSYTPPSKSFFSVLQCRLEMHAAALGDAQDATSPTPTTAIAPEIDGEAGTLAGKCSELSKMLQDFLDKPADMELLKRLQGQVRTALQVSEQALDRYGFDQIAFSYNGGKDCLVILIIYLAAIHNHFSRLATQNKTSSPSAFPSSIPSVYIKSDHPFAEVDNFVDASGRDYHLAISALAAPMKAAFAQYLNTNTNVEAIFVGTRRTDPHGAKLTHFDHTDHGWPAFMRVHPVIDWHYQEIWAFLKHFEIPYCILYDQGYTSLGGTRDTLPNPHLQQSGHYRPAHELLGDDEERLGRDVPVVTSNQK